VLPFGGTRFAEVIGVQGFARQGAVSLQTCYHFCDLIRVVYEKLTVVQAFEDFYMGLRVDGLEMLGLGLCHEGLKSAVPVMDIGSGNRSQFIGIH
jgi:hypothetical protein